MKFMEMESKQTWADAGMSAACAALAVAGFKDAAAAAAAAVYWPAVAWETGRNEPAETAGLFTAFTTAACCGPKFVATVTGFKGL